jgi:hypothetical protein
VARALVTLHRRYRDAAGLASPESVALALIGLADYFAGALLMPHPPSAGVSLLTRVRRGGGRQACAPAGYGAAGRRTVKGC